MKKIGSIGLPMSMVAAAQQPKFEMADIHVSATAHSFAQNFGGVLRDGRYIK